MTYLVCNIAACGHSEKTRCRQSPLEGCMCLFLWSVTVVDSL